MLGIELGDNLMPAAEKNNEKGFWEDLDINALNIELLGVLERDWSSLSPISNISLDKQEVRELLFRGIQILRAKTESVEKFGLKDPRLCRLLPFWKVVFKHLNLDVHYVIASRNPISIAHSLELRDHFAREKSYQLWLDHMHSALIDTHGESRIIVDFDCLIEAPETQLSRIANAFQLQFDSQGLAFKEYVKEFLDQKLRHSVHAAKDIDFDTAASDKVMQLYCLLREFSDVSSEPESSLVKRLDATLASIRSERDSYLPMLNYVTTLEKTGEELELKLVAARRVAETQSLEAEAGLRDAESKIQMREAKLRDYELSLAEKSGSIVQLEKLLSESRAELIDANALVSSTQRQLDDCEVLINEQKQLLAAVNLTVDDLNAQKAELASRIDELHRSTSWRLTRPLRWIKTKWRNIRRVIELIPTAVELGGGMRQTTWKVIKRLCKDGVSGVFNDIRVINELSIVRSSNSVREWSNQQTETSSPADHQIPMNRNDYCEWVSRYDTITSKQREQIISKINDLDERPLVSIVMPTYNPNVEWLIAAIESVRAQLYQNWELCVADDASTDHEVRKVLNEFQLRDQRIKVIFREENGHISAASNSALSLVSGDWVALLDHDDLLPAHALYHVVTTILSNPKAKLIYSDEDKLNDLGVRHSPYFKSDWNEDLFYSHNMFCHFGIYQTEVIRKVGGFRVGFEGAQDYDLALRCSEHVKRSEIVHIPRVLYHWREHQQSTAKNVDAKPYAVTAGERALNEHFQRNQIRAHVSFDGHGYRAKYELPEEQPLVSLIIPTRNGRELVQQCVESIFKRTTYRNFEILIVDNGSDEPETLDYLSILGTHHQCTVIRDERDFNYSALNNSAVAHARGEIIALVNNDIEVISTDWLEEMVSHALRPEVGAVGARLWYPNDTLQHGGVILGVGGVAGHSHKHLSKGLGGYFSRACLTQELSAVTAACLIVRKSVYQEVGGLNETDLTVAFNDIDFCLRVREAGYKNIWTPYAELYHHESASRGYENNPIKRERFAREVKYMREKWGSVLDDDPAYNPNLTLLHENFELAWPPRNLFN